MLWVKAFHIVFVVSWYAGLLYLPRLFVYHAMCRDEPTDATLKVMERKLMIMTHIGGTLSWLFGALLIFSAPYLMDYGWPRLKLVLGLALTAASQEDYIGALNAIRLLKNRPTTMMEVTINTEFPKARGKFTRSKTST